MLVRRIGALFFKRYTKYSQWRSKSNPHSMPHRHTLHIVAVGTLYLQFSMLHLIPYFIVQECVSIKNTRSRRSNRYALCVCTFAISACFFSCIFKMVNSVEYMNIVPMKSIYKIFFTYTLHLFWTYNVYTRQQRHDKTEKPFLKWSWGKLQSRLRPLLAHLDCFDV